MDGNVFQEFPRLFDIFAEKFVTAIPWLHVARDLVFLDNVWKRNTVNLPLVLLSNDAFTNRQRLIILEVLHQNAVECAPTSTVPWHLEPLALVGDTQTWERDLVAQSRIQQNA